MADRPPRSRRTRRRAAPLYAPHVSRERHASSRPLPRLQATRAGIGVDAGALSVHLCCVERMRRRRLSFADASTKFRCCGVGSFARRTSPHVCQSVATAALNSDSHGTLILISATAAFCARNFAARRRRHYQRVIPRCRRPDRRLRARVSNQGERLEIGSVDTFASTRVSERLRRTTTMNSHSRREGAVRVHHKQRNTVGQKALS